jgi:hypothetical protein
MKLLLLSNQVIGSPNGGEAIIHSVAAAMDHLKDDDCILQVDFSNAFNNISRIKIIELTALYLPSLLNLVKYLYSVQGFLKLGQSDEYILSCWGVQQGCPLAPLCLRFSLAQP